MADPPPPYPPASPSTPLSPAAQTVTASELVRRFGEWQRRALTAPVYVLNHRRPQLVLASIAFMRALSARRPPGIAEEVEGATAIPDAPTIPEAEILEALPEPALIVAADGTIVAAARAARLCLGERAAPGTRLTEVPGLDPAGALETAVARVAASRIGEIADLPGPVGEPWLTLTIAPHPRGALIAGRAAAAEAVRDAAMAQARSLAAAVAVLPGTALATIDPRGRLVAPDESLAALTGRSRAALDELAAAQMLAEPSRAAFDQAVGAVFDGGPAMIVDAMLRSDQGETTLVTVSLAPLARGRHVIAIVAVLTTR